MRAGGEQTGGRRRVRLLDEARQPMHRVDTGKFFTHFDIAVAGFRCRRLHAEGHDMPSARRLGRTIKRGMQGGHVGDRGIGGHHPQNSIRIGLRLQQRRRGDGRRAIAPDRLQHDPRAFDAGQAELLSDQEAVFVVAHDDGRGEPGARGAQGGFLDQRPIGDQGPELLGETFARNRP